MENNERLLTANQAKKRLGFVYRQSLYDHIRRGHIKHIRAGRRYLIPESEIEALESFGYEGPKTTNRNFWRRWVAHRGLVTWQSADESSLQETENDEMSAAEIVDDALLSVQELQPHLSQMLNGWESVDEKAQWIVVEVLGRLDQAESLLETLRVRLGEGER